MQRIALSKAKPGMTLAEPVTRPDGLILVGPGLELTESIIDRIRSAGADTVTIEGYPLGEGEGQEDLRVLADGLSRAFRRYRKNAFMMTLHNMLVEYFAQAIAARKAREEEIARRRAEAAAKAAAEEKERLASAKVKPS